MRTSYAEVNTNESSVSWRDMSKQETYMPGIWDCGSLQPNFEEEGSSDFNQAIQKNQVHTILSWLW